MVAVQPRDWASCPVITLPSGLMAAPAEAPPGPGGTPRLRPGLMAANQHTRGATGSHNLYWHKVQGDIHQGLLN